MIMIILLKNHTNNHNHNNDNNDALKRFYKHWSYTLAIVQTDG